MENAITESKSLASVCIIIPCFNEEDYIENCVHSCLSQSYQGSVQICVVDGSSTDKTPFLLKELILQYPHQVFVVDNPLRTTPIALNLGLNFSSSDFSMILGAHSTLPKNYIQQCIQAFQNHPDAYCVGGVILNQYADITAENIGLAMSSPFGVGNATFRIGGEKKWVDTVAFGMYKKEVFEKIGGFNEDLIRNQDDEFNFRMSKAGLKILFDPNIQCDYFVRASYKKLWKQYFQYGFWKVYVNLLHGQVTTIRQLFPAGFVLYLMVGSLSALFLKKFLLPLSLPMILYLCLSLIFGFQKKKSQSLGIAIVFPILHISYGWGYWKGIIQLALLKIKPNAQHAKHNR